MFFGKMMFKYSVIIPHFNDEVRLKRLLDSIPSREDIEVIVVDDRSDTDDIYNVVDNCQLPRLTLLLNNGIKSAGTCRNLGIEKSAGKYLIFADSDDFFTPDAFIHFDNAIGEKSCDLYFFKVSSFDSRGNYSNREQVVNMLLDSYLKEKNWETESKIRLTHYVPWGKVFRADFIKSEKIRFDQTLVSNDGIFSLLSGKRAKDIFVSEEVCYSSIVREKSLTTSKIKNNHRIRVSVYIRYYKMLDQREIKVIGASPMPLIYSALNYGMLEFIRTIYVFRISGVPIFKNFMSKLKRLIRTSTFGHRAK